MKGDERLLTTLNQLLADELTAISQYMVHSEMCENWGYDKLHKAVVDEELANLPAFCRALMTGEQHVP